jgi:SHAQKYF class myb-like DNA-binding protein
MHSTRPEASFSQAHTDPVVNPQQMMSAGNDMGPGNGVNNNTNMAARQRLRWTNELHERFVEAVTQLGGPDSMYTTVVPLLLVNSTLQNI